MGGYRTGAKTFLELDVVAGAVVCEPRQHRSAPGPDRRNFAGIGDPTSWLASSCCPDKITWIHTADSCEIHFAPRNETMVETIESFVGLYIAKIVLATRFSTCEKEEFAATGTFSFSLSLFFRTPPAKSKFRRQ